MRLARTAAFLLLTAVLHAETHYEIDLTRSAAGWLGIRIDTTCSIADCDFQMPVWNATYQVRDFAQYVSGFRAQRADGAPITTRKLGPSVWRLAASAGDRVSVAYRVRADRPGPFGAVADSRHVCLNLPQILAYPVEERAKPFALRFAHIPPNWKTAIALPEREGVFQAESYDRLVDTPVHLSDFKETQFELAGKRIRIVVHGPEDEYDIDQLRRSAEKLTVAATDLMEDVPFPAYTFVYHFTSRGGGGMEYRNGTSIHARRKCGQCDVAELTAHEFFHLWNVKRIRPASLEPVDFAKPVLTPSLWFSEGVTSAYSQFLRLRAGMTQPSSFLGNLAQLIYDHESRPASRLQSAEESSLEAWLEGYPSYRRPDRSISYYAKGELIGHLLDLTIRDRTANRRSLDDVMRLLNKEYAAKNRFFEDTVAIEQAASRVAGADLSSVFDELVRAASPIPWDNYLGLAGFALAKTEQAVSDMGLGIVDREDGVVVSAVEPLSPAEEAGFRRGDRLLTVSGEPAKSADSVRAGLKTAASKAVSLEIERDGEPVSLVLRSRETTETLYRIIEVEGPAPLQLAVRRGWLERKTDGDTPNAPLR